MFQNVVGDEIFRDALNRFGGKKKKLNETPFN